MELVSLLVHYEEFLKKQKRQEQNMGKIGKKNVYFFFQNILIHLLWRVIGLDILPHCQSWKFWFQFMLSFKNFHFWDRHSFSLNSQKPFLGRVWIFSWTTQCVFTGLFVALASFSLLIRQTMGKGWLLVVYNSVFKYFKTSNSPKKICPIIAQSLVSIKQLDYELEISVLWWLTRAHCQP